MLPAAVIRLCTHEVANTSWCHIFAQTTLAMDGTREQNLLSFEGDDEA